MKLRFLPFFYCLFSSSYATSHDEIASSSNQTDSHGNISGGYRVESDLRNLQEDGQFCNISTALDCFVQEAGKRDMTKCELMEPIEACGPIEMTFIFEYCNNMDGFDVSLLEKKTFAKVAGETYRDSQGFVDLLSNSCRSFEQNVTIDSCLRSNVPGSFKAEGWVKGFEQTFGYYCYAWSFQKIKIFDSSKEPSTAPTSPATNGKTVQPSTEPTQISTAVPSISYFPTLIPSTNRKASLEPSQIKTVNPTDVPSYGTASHPSLVPTVEATITPSFNIQIPSMTPTNFDSSSPSRGSIVTSVNLESKCFGEPQGFIGSGAFVLSCEYIVPSASVDDCLRDIKLVYTVVNESNEDLIIQGLVVGQEGRFEELVNPDISLILEPVGQHTIEYILKRDICSVESNRQIDAIVFGVGVDSGIPVSKGADLVLAIPVPSRIQLLSPIACAVDGIPCSDYFTSINQERIDECIVTATFRYVVENIGIACIDIETVQLQFGSEDIQQLSLGDKSIFTNFCPEDMHEFENTQTLDLCKYEGENAQIEISINNEVQATGTLSIGQFVLPFPSLLTPMPSMQLSEHPTRNPDTWNPPTQPQKILSPSKLPAESNMPVQAPTPEVPYKAPAVLTPNTGACDLLPNSASFIFKPRPCRNSSDYQSKSKREKKGLKKRSEKHAGKGRLSSKVKSDCIDYSTVETTSRLVISSAYGSTVLFDGIVTHDEKFAIDNFSHAKNVQVRIYALNDDNENLSQSFVLDLSCEMNIKYGESFGSLVFVGYEKLL